MGKKTGPKPRPPVDRVMARVEIGECWRWTGPTNEHGYAFVRTGSQTDGTRRRECAHRIVYEALVGPIPIGAVLHHRCGVHTCVNPEHLEVIPSQAEHARRHIGDRARDSLGRLTGG